MRLSVLAVSLFLLFSQSVLAQHSSGGGGGSGGSSASFGGGGGGSHGGGSGGGSSGGYSGGHSSSGSASHSSGSSGSSHTGNSSHSGPVASRTADLSHSRPGSRPGSLPDFLSGIAGVSRPEARTFYYSTVPGDSSVVHDHLLDRALAKVRVEMPADFKRGQPVRIEAEKRKGSNRAPGVATVRVLPWPKPCHGRKCPAPPPPVPPFPLCSSGNWAGCYAGEPLWRFSEYAYGLVQNNCGYVGQLLTEEEDKAETLRGLQQVACSPAPLSAECASATNKVAQEDLRVERLRERYGRCVSSNLRRRTVTSMSRP